MILSTLPVACVKSSVFVVSTFFVVVDSSTFVVVSSDSVVVDISVVVLLVGGRQHLLISTNPYQIILKLISTLRVADHLP